VRWQRIFAGYAADQIAFETRSGDFIIAGRVPYYSSFTFREDVRIMRLDRDGNIRWAKVYGTAGWDPEGRDVVAVIQELSNGDLIFAGHTNGAGTGTDDMWVLKTNALGEIPNCVLALEDREIRTGAVSSAGERMALAGVSLIERETILIIEEGPGLLESEARTMPICSPTP
jgi:hypothetical protein